MTVSGFRDLGIGLRKPSTPLGIRGAFKLQTPALSPCKPFRQDDVRMLALEAPFDEGRSPPSDLLQGGLNP